MDEIPCQDLLWPKNSGWFLCGLICNAHITRGLKVLALVRAVNSAKVAI